MITLVRPAWASVWWSEAVIGLWKQIFLGVERSRELRVIQNADSFSTNLPYHQQQLLHSQYLVPAQQSCTYSHLSAINSQHYARYNFTLSSFNAESAIRNHLLLKSKWFSGCHSGRCGWPAGEGFHGILEAKSTFFFSSGLGGKQGKVANLGP